MKFSPDGSFISEFGKSTSEYIKFEENINSSKFNSLTVDGVYPPPPGTFSVPHSVTLIEDWNLLCVADRENERIQCFSAGLRNDLRALPTGTFVKKAEGLGRVFAVDNQSK